MSDSEFFPPNSTPLPSEELDSAEAALPPSTTSTPTTGPGLGIGRSIFLLVAFYAVFIVGCFIAGAVGGFLMAVSGGAVNPLRNIFALITVPQIVAWIVTIKLGLRWLGEPLRVAGSFHSFPPRLLPALLAASFGAAILLAELITWIPMPEAWREAASAQRASSHVIWILIPVVVVAPIAEEIFFRGVMLRGFLERYSIRKTIWISASMFAIFHLNPWQIIFAFPLGLWYAWIAIRTGSVLPSMISHAAVNASVNFLIGPLASVLGYTVAEMQDWRHYPASILAVAAACLVVGGYAHWQQLTRIGCSAGGDSQQFSPVSTDLDAVPSAVDVSDG